MARLPPEHQVSPDISVPTVAELLAQAKGFHSAGRIREAEPLYRKILEAEPQHVEVQYLFGAACHALGHTHEALASLQQAVRQQPDYAEAHCVLGLVLMGQGQIDAAIASLQQGARLRPGSTEIMNHLRHAIASKYNDAGLALAESGRLDEAASCYQKALEAQPNYVPAHGNLGSLFKAQGKLHESNACYRRVLQLQPNSPLVHNDLGTVAQQQSRFDEAATYYRRALELEPDFAEAQANLGTLLAEQEQLDEAAACFRRALQLRPDFVDTHNNLGAVLINQGKFDEAIECCRRALGIAPNYAEASSTLAIALRKRGQLDEAADCWRRALKLKPDYLEALTNLAVALTELELPDEAVACHRRVLELQPDLAVTHCGLGVALTKLHKYDEAEASFRRALELQPDFAEAFSNLAFILAEQGQLDQAAACCQRALDLIPNYGDAFHNFGALRARQGRFDEALAYQKRVFESKPDDVDAHCSYGGTLLTMGRLVEGWPEYEWRFNRKDMRQTPLDQPRWDSSPLGGRTILLRTEQGHGDMLQFIRYVEFLSQQGAKVVVECARPLQRLIASCAGVAAVVAPGELLPHFDVHVPLLSLPGIFQTSLESIPCQVPYLWPDPQLVEQWKGELVAEPDLKIGIAWQGNPSQERDRYRSFPLAHFAPIARMNGARLYSLQMGMGHEQLAELDADCPITDLADRLGDFHNTAAIVRNLDLVITCDSAPAHLAGSLGMPVWVALDSAPDWRWLRDRDDTPWYPTMRLFRQTSAGDWHGVFRRIQAELAQLIAAR